MPEENAQESAKPTTSGIRHRSPNYPSFDIETAIKKARMFYDRQRRNPVDAESAIESLGYKNVKSSEATRSLATLIVFGLLDDTGKRGQSRLVKLSNDGYRLIAVLEEDEPERLQLIQALALRPKVYSDLAKKFPTDLPTDQVIRRMLKNDMGFNPVVVDDVVKDFRATYEFAKLGDCGILSEDNSDKEDSDEEQHDEQDPPDTGIKKPVIKPPAGGSSGGKNVQTPPVANRTYAIPMQGGREILLQAPGATFKGDLPYLNLLSSYIELLKAEATAQQEEPTRQDGGND